jgi:hypothetical protein
MGDICQIGAPPDLTFKATFEAVDWALLVVLLMGVVVFTYIGGQAGSNARRLLGPRGAAFAAAMAWFLLIP